MFELVISALSGKRYDAVHEAHCVRCARNKYI